MPPLRHLALLGAFAATAFAQTPPPATAPVPAPAPSAPAPASAPKKITLEVARTGNEVLLTWTLPEGEVRMLEIMRNTAETAPGRGRVGTTRATVNVFSDTVPDANVTYWYWLKLTRPTGEVINVGPVATPSATVWIPTS